MHTFPRPFPWFFSLLPLAAIMLIVVSCAPADGPDRQEPGPGSSADMTEDEILETAREIHSRVITIDTHVDIPTSFASDVDPGVRGEYQNDLPKMREGGLDAAFFIVYVGQGQRTPEGYAGANRTAMSKFDGIRRMAYEIHPEQIELAYSADDVERIHGEGKLVALIGVENAFALGTDLSDWARYRDLGARYVSLTHNGHNDFGDAAVEVARLGDDGPEWNGLSPLGQEAVAELNRLGIMLDVSHAGRETMLQAVRLSRAPIIASHSSMRAVADHPRNLDDEQLRALAEAGGVAQATALGAFVRVQPPERAERVAALRERMGLTSNADIRSLEGEDLEGWNREMATIEDAFPSASLRDFIDHVEYAVNLVGIDHVGISSDFDGGGGVEGWMDASETLNVTVELVRRGFSEEEIRKLWGGNLLRVLREVERVAGEIREEAGS
ncbi:pyoverdine-tailoring dipeptidase-like protein PvdM [soil metagenome]